MMMTLKQTSGEPAARAEAGVEFWDTLDMSTSETALLRPVQENVISVHAEAKVDKKILRNAQKLSDVVGQREARKSQKRNRQHLFDVDLASSSDSSDKKRRRRDRSRDGSKKTLIAPRVLVSLPKIKKYPGQYKKIFDDTLRRNGVEFQVNSSIRTMMLRPATKDVGKYWYVLWQFIFAYVAKYPQWTLHRCTKHVKNLLDAQRVAMEHFATMKFDRKPQQLQHQPENQSEQRDKKWHESGHSCVSNADTGANIVDIDDRQETNDVYREIFRLIAAEIDYQVDDAISNIVNQESGCDDAEGDERLHLQIRLFECCWMFIYAIVERLGEMYLKRSCLNGNIFQLAQIQRAFADYCAARNIAQSLTVVDFDEERAKDNEQNEQRRRRQQIIQKAYVSVDNSCVSSMRENLRQAFEALCSAEQIKQV